LFFRTNEIEFINFLEMGMGCCYGLKKEEEQPNLFAGIFTLDVSPKSENDQIPPPMVNMVNEKRNSWENNGRLMYMQNMKKPNNSIKKSVRRRRRKPSNVVNALGNEFPTAFSKKKSGSVSKSLRSGGVHSKRKRDNVNNLSIGDLHIPLVTPSPKSAQKKFTWTLGIAGQRIDSSKNELQISNNVIDVMAGMSHPPTPSFSGNDLVSNLCPKCNLCSECRRTKFAELKTQELGNQIDQDDELGSEEEKHLLPHYFDMVPQMFYRFAGISQYSNSNTKMSKKDFDKLLKCLSLDHLFIEFLDVMPTFTENSVGDGIITIDMFSDLFSTDFAQVLIESRLEYESLCSALLTMKCLDTGGLNRILFEQFKILYESLHGKNVSKVEAKAKFDHYDTDGIGFLTIVGIFMFCLDEEENEEASETADEDQSGN